VIDHDRFGNQAFYRILGQNVTNRRLATPLLFPPSKGVVKNPASASWFHVGRSLMVLPE
jgi:hypothetical protein